MTHILGIFWRDQTARRLTYWHFQPRQERALTRAEQILALLPQLTTLQIYGALLDNQPLPMTLRPAPATGWAVRLEVSLLPASALNPKEGINLLRFGLPGPTPAVRQLVQSGDWAAPLWQQLEREIFDYLCLPSGIGASVSPTRIKKAELIRLDESRHPEKDRSPLESIIIKTTQEVERATRSYQQLATPHERQRLERHQARLQQWQQWRAFEQEFFEQALALTHLSQLSPLSPRNLPIKVLEEISRAMTIEQSQPPQEAQQSQPAQQSKRITSDSQFVPELPTDLSQWADVPPQHFADASMWTHRSQILTHQEMSERTYYRWFKRLEALGLRSLPAKDNARVVLIYQPDLTHALNQLNQQTAQSEVEPQPSPATQITVTAPTSATSATSADLAHTLAAIQLQQQQLATALARLEANLASERRADLARVEQQFSSLAHQHAQTAQQLPLGQLFDLMGQLAHLHELPAALRQLSNRLPSNKAKAKVKTKLKAKAKAPAKAKTKAQTKKPSKKSPSKSPAKKKTVAKSKPASKKKAR